MGAAVWPRAAGLCGLQLQCGRRGIQCGRGPAAARRRRHNTMAAAAAASSGDGARATVAWSPHYRDRSRRSSRSRSPGDGRHAIPG
eukprot:scaffold13324_cov29-Phaeocystis_antarctica.AAC.2